MKIRFAAAAVLAPTGIVHVGLGGPQVHHPLQAAAAVPEPARHLALLRQFVAALFVLGALVLRPPRAHA